MNTELLRIDPENPESNAIKKAADILKCGGLVAFPTETVYGLGGNGLSKSACKKIYAAKGRPSDNPLILHISRLEELLPLVSEIPKNASLLMEQFWPGPLTIVFPKSALVPYEVTGGLESVAVRFPENKIARALIRASGLPIAAPSANSSGKPSPTRASHVEFDLNGKIDMILDGGAADFGLESTIIDITSPVPMLLRPGAITLEMLKEVLGEVLVDPAVFGAKTERPKAPGMKYTHYSPLAKVILASGSTNEMIEKINKNSALAIKNGFKVGILTTDENIEKYPSKLIEDGLVRSAGSRADELHIGAMLFKLLRKFDYLGVDIIYSETFSPEGEGLAIMNRLQKAAGGNII